MLAFCWLGYEGPCNTQASINGLFVFAPPVLIVDWLPIGAKVVRKICPNYSYQNESRLASGCIPQSLPSMNIGNCLLSLFHILHVRSCSSAPKTKPYNGARLSLRCLRSSSCRFLENLRNPRPDSLYAVILCLDRSFVCLYLRLSFYTSPDAWQSAVVRETAF